MSDDLELFEAAKTGLFFGVAFSAVGLAKASDVPKFAMAYVLVELLSGWAKVESPESAESGYSEDPEDPEKCK